MVYLLISFLLLFILATYGFRKGNQNTSDISVQYIQITNNDQQPATPKSLSILHLSDLHLENISISPQELYNKVVNEKIDLIALTGDFLDRKRTIAKLKPYLEVLERLRPTYGTYAVFGNHDYVLSREPFNRLTRMLEEHGCQTLRNESVIIQTKQGPINIIGIDDFSTGRSDLEESYENVGAGYKLVLTHDPNIVMHMKDYYFDYLLAGHFHGGQICYPKPYHLVKMGKLVKLNMVKGLHYFHNKPFYISEGLGQTGLNIRVGSRPEITFHKVTIQNNQEIKLSS
ncbi:metallophosphoesterase [Bacillus sp. RD4P76]|uniref:Metallophosphoesterase n=1 Tax=Bacillus suaedaesalsae TaxID=2810349 RepID=A0ABS2DLG1_9BACI|nr:metallophosphoesterase [Bacillus suaedaesalsae]